MMILDQLLRCPRLNTLVIGAILATSAHAQILLDDFNSGTTSGVVIGSSTWSGNVTQNTDTITVGGTALDDNGWRRASTVPFDATGMNYIAVTGQRDSGHAATSFKVEFLDENLKSTVFTAAASDFGMGSLTVVNMFISGWTPGFDFTAIEEWSIGGGDIVGNANFRMTLDEMHLSASAVPEPSAFAAILGMAAMVFATGRNRRR